VGKNIRVDSGHTLHIDQLDKHNRYRKVTTMSVGDIGNASMRGSDGPQGAPMPMDRQGEPTSFAYTTYVHATAEQVWQALTDPELTMRWWRHHSAGGKSFISDWKKGSTYDMAHPEVGLVVSDPDQVILESDPYRRLAYRWHTFTPDWAAQVGMDEPTATAWRAEPRSTVTFDIADDDKGVVKLTVIHDGFGPGSNVLQGISAGWPAVLASLKTLLETGSPLPW
jgi:uncharacterized protein YndB with AHSA1/START domain